MSQQVPSRIKTIALSGTRKFDVAVTAALREVRESGSRAIGLRLDSQFDADSIGLIHIAHVLIVDPQPKPERDDAQDNDPA